MGGWEREREADGRTDRQTYIENQKEKDRYFERNRKRNRRYHKEMEHSSNFLQKDKNGKGVLANIIHPMLTGFKT